PHAGRATQALGVAGRSTDEHDPGVSLAFAEHDLGRALIEVTAGAAGGGPTQSRERGPDRRNERRGGRMWLARRHARLYARRRANGAERQYGGASAGAGGNLMGKEGPAPPPVSPGRPPPARREMHPGVRRADPGAVRL